ncbi:MerR family transcriptional regulator [Sphingomonas sp. ASV193]|uniref:MerR family transcriptional regulator n=1 Tax=Sphingomonas sp. ASV193 TaxID=3144405 RepID=UPI0032E91DEE
MADGKSPDAFRTIGELSAELGVAQHILRYWETKFPQLRPLQRAGNRRYYRPDDVALARRIHRLLNEQGYTVRGVQKLLGDKSAVDEPATPPPTSAPFAFPSDARSDEPAAPPSPGVDLDRIAALRDRLVSALRG